MASVMSLPAELLHLIQEYGHIGALLTTCRSLHALQKDIFIFRLTRAASNSFAHISSFRSLVMSRMVRPERQLALNMESSSDVNLSDFSHVFSLNCSSCKKVTDMSAVANVHSLNLSDCVGVKDVSPLGHVHRSSRDVLEFGTLALWVMCTHWILALPAASVT